MAAASKLEIYYDGSCQFCQRSRATVEPRDTYRRLRFVDYNDPLVAASAPFSREELGREMHVRLPDGSWSAGYAAWLHILRELPRWAWLGRLLSFPPARWLGPVVYRWVAQHRTLLPGMIQPCTPESCTPRRRAS